METNEKIVLPANQIASCSDISCEFLVDPIPRPRPVPFKVKRKPEEQRVILVDNDKPNSLQILERTQKILQKRGVNVEDEIWVKGMSAGMPMPPSFLDRYAGQKGMLVFGIND